MGRVRWRIPGRLPADARLCGCHGRFDLGPGLLFAMQFMWQFPHFWAIAWVLDEDYATCGFPLASREVVASPSQCLPDPFVHLVRYPGGHAPVGVRVVGPWAMAVSVVVAVDAGPAGRNLFLTREKADDAP
jgi:protoheme IX farnesyltransferase